MTASSGLSGLVLTAIKAALLTRLALRLDAARAALNEARAFAYAATTAYVRALAREREKALGREVDRLEIGLDVLREEIERAAGPEPGKKKET